MNLRTLWASAIAVLPKVISAAKTPTVFAGKMIHEHKAIRRGTLIWVCYLVTHATLKVFENPIAITSPEVAAYATVTALLGVVIGFYNSSRNQEAPKP